MDAKVVYYIRLLIKPFRYLHSNKPLSFYKISAMQYAWYVW